MRSKLSGGVILFLMITALVMGSSSTNTCVAEGPVLTDKAGAPVWLTTADLIQSSTHCAAPKMPALLRSAQFEGQVLVDLVVNEKGNVTCVKLISGPPIVAGAAVEAAKQWTFRPKRQGQKEVSFYGHLVFHFSTSGPSKNGSTCTEAHW